MRGVLPRNRLCRNGTVEGDSPCMRNIGVSVLLAVFAVAPVAASCSDLDRSRAGVPHQPGRRLEIMVWGDDRLQKVVLGAAGRSLGFRSSGRSWPLPPASASAGSFGGSPATISRRRSSGDGDRQESQRLSVFCHRQSEEPGTFTPGRYVSALEAIGIAGGPTDFADINRIRIVRKVGGRVETIPYWLVRR